MHWAAACVATIPCRNEARQVADVIRRVRKFLPFIMVVDDASSDATPAIARASGAEVLTQPDPTGKGAALRIAWSQARERGFSWALSLDGDGQHCPEDIPAFFDRAALTGASLVIGNRMAAQERMPFLRRHVNRWMSRRLERLLRLPIPDSQCGFRLLNLRAEACLSIAADHFEIESETLLAFALAGHRIEFVPVQTVYGSEFSKIRPVQDSVRWLKWWLGARRRARGPNFLPLPAPGDSRVGS